MDTSKIYLLRGIHALVIVYLTACLGYLYYAAATGHIGHLVTLAIISLAVEGLLVFGLNKGDCPLNHVQRKVGDDKPFFEFFLPPTLAKLAIPAFAILSLLAAALLLVRLIVN